MGCQGAKSCASDGSKQMTTREEAAREAKTRGDEAKRKMEKEMANENSTRRTGLGGRRKEGIGLSWRSACSVRRVPEDRMHQGPAEVESSYEKKGRCKKYGAPSQVKELSRKRPRARRRCTCQDCVLFLALQEQR
jgi:hypothetical protein